MGNAVGEERMKPGIGTDHFEFAGGRRIPIEDGLQILSDGF
jgi:hypothetical protein